MLKSIFQKFAFTKNELKVIIFFVVILLIGSGIKLYKNFSSDKNYFNYMQSDNNFANFLTVLNRDPENKMYNNDTNQLENLNLNNEELSKISKLQIFEDTTKNKLKKKSKKGADLKEKSININTASKSELMLLPGVGEATAEKIIKYREEHNGFKQIEEIMEVKGIGIKKFEKMKLYIIVQ